MNVDHVNEYLSIGEIADLLHVQTWRIARLYTLRVLPEPIRVAGRRLIPKAQLPMIIAALKERGWYSSIEGGAQK